MKISPAKYELVGDFLAGVKKKLYFCTGIPKTIFDVLKKLTIMNKQSLYKIIVTIATALVTCAAIALGLTSCNVTRTVTTQSQYFQHGDTTCTIVTKTVESYDETKKLH